MMLMKEEEKEEHMALAHKTINYKEEWHIEFLVPIYLTMKATHMQSNLFDN